MNKIEYIKLLRELSNDFKIECIFDNDFKEKTNEFFEDINFEKNSCQIKMMIESIISIICICNDKKILSLLSSLFVLINLFNYYKSDSYEKSVKADCDTIKYCLDNYETQIKRIEHAIEFLQSINEEESQKYLSYKMGDSRKKLTSLD